MRLIDCHSHTAYSGHGSGTVAEAVARARQLGLATYAQTEHLWLPEELDPGHADSMSTGQTERYLAELAGQRELLAREGSEMELVIGVEADWLPGRSEELCRLCAPFEYVVASVHFVEGLPLDYAADVGAWPVFGVDGTWRRYFEAWLSMAASDAPVSCFAHPDLPKKYGFYPSFDMHEYFELMSEAAAARGALVEVNTAGLRKDVGECYPSLELLRCFQQRGVECTVGADAHSPAEVAAGIGQAYKLMRLAGYEYVTAPRPDGGRRHFKL